MDEATKVRFNNIDASLNRIENMQKDQWEAITSNKDEINKVDKSLSRIKGVFGGVGIIGAIVAMFAAVMEFIEKWRG